MFHIIYIVIGILTGMLTGFTGGSGMSVLMSGLLLFGVNIRSVITITFFVTLFNSIAALPAYIKNRNISIKDSLIIGIPGAISVFPGYQFSQKIENDYIVWIMIIALFILGIKIIISSKTKEIHKTKPQIKNKLLLVLFGIVIGIFIGIFGGGGGIIIGIILITFFHYDTKKAIGISISVMGLVALSGIIINMKYSKFDLIPVLSITIPSVLTSYIISHKANKVDPNVIKRILGVYLILVTIILILKKAF